MIKKISKTDHQKAAFQDEAGICRQTEEKLQDAEERFRSTIESIIDGYFETDLAGNFTFFSDSICRQILGYSKEETMGINYRVYTDEESANKVFREFNKIYTTGEPSKQFEWTIIRKDGTKKHIASSAALIRDVLDKPIGFRGIIFDITERKRAEESLRESDARHREREESYRNILDNMEEAYYEVDLKGNLTFFNTTAVTNIGYTNDELMGMNYRQYTDEENAGKLLETYSKVFLTGESVKGLDWALISKAGKKIPIEGSISLMRDAQENPIGFRGIIRDITERKQAEQALMESEEKYRSILENIRDAYFEVDLAGNFTFFNDSLCRMTGCSREELLGTNYTKFSDEESAKIVFNTFNQVYKTGMPTVAIDWPIFLGNNAKGHVEASILLRKDSAGNPIGFKGVLRDVTERKNAEAELQKARDKLLHAEKLSALGQLSIVVAHEILNPLNIISMELQILQAMEDMPAEVQEEIKICMLQIDRIVNIAEELKQLTRSPEKKMELADINSLIARVLKIYKLHLRTDEIKTEVHYQSELPNILMDYRKMEQVILNLISNARAAMEGRENKVLRITTDWGENHHQVRIVIADTGVGIKNEHMAKLFDPFFTTKELGKGTGLGLYISQDIIRDHGGKIWAENNESGGASFYISLPLN